MKYHLFPEALFFRAYGRDARRYLNARLTNDLSNVQSLDCLLAAALNPQARTEALCRAVILSTEEILLALDGGDKASIQSALSRYIVADRVHIEDITEKMALVTLLGVDETEARTLGVAGATASKALRLADTDTLVLKTTRLGERAFDLLIPKESKPRIDALINEHKATQLDGEAYSAKRFQAGEPAFPTEVNSESMILETGPAEAIAERKGCYTGQEVVEKTRQRGKSPRRLALVSLATTPAVGDRVRKEGKSLGSIISWRRCEGSILAFTLLRNEEGVEGDLKAVDDSSVSFVRWAC